MDRARGQALGLLVRQRLRHARYQSRVHADGTAQVEGKAARRESARAAAEAAMQPAEGVGAIAEAAPAAAIAAAIQKPATKVAGKAAARVKRRPERVHIAKRPVRKLRKARA